MSVSEFLVIKYFCMNLWSFHLRRQTDDSSDYLSWHVQPVIHIFSINEAFVIVTQFCSLFSVFLWHIPFLSVKFYIWEQIVLYVCEYCSAIQAHISFILCCAVKKHFFCFFWSSFSFEASVSMHTEQSCWHGFQGCFQREVKLEGRMPCLLGFLFSMTLHILNWNIETILREL